MIKLTAFFKKNIIYLAVIVILILMLITSLFAFRNQRIMHETTSMVKEAELALNKSTELIRWLNLMDLGVRGYALGKTDPLLDPFTIAMKGNPADMDTIRRIMEEQKFPTQNFEKYITVIHEYADFCRQMIALAKVDSMTQFKQLMAEDRGFQVWKTYQGFATDFVAHERALKEQAENRYTAAVRSNVIIQILLLVLGIPCLYIIFYRIRGQESHRQSLLLNLEQNNRKLVFDPGTPVNEDARAILDTSIENIRNASDFIRKITSGDFGATWPGLNEQNSTLNHENLSATLINMRDQMKRIQEEDGRRIWATEGLTKFTELIRQHQDDAIALADHATRFLVRYLEAQQAGTFILQEDEAENQYLELTACYAFDKKKFVEKRIDIGQGLIGQTFLEGSTIIMKAVPDGYTQITSGLGDATPSCILIVPMKYSEKIEGVLELAGFTEWQEYQQIFAEKATEYMAAAISTVRATQKMRTMVEQMRAQTQQLHSQEEEMRQNMEELAATNEEMLRKEAEYINKLRAAGID
ncbi:MAG TPA: CHASE3 domain-containing protein [Ohtaekwangia sp.]|uniref:CHASE3 domain-containing protein n=1 Tax=Ohtaekwangia sp. TaxID=2066019 RepID=UPI002F9357C9